MFNIFNDSMNKFKINCNATIVFSDSQLRALRKKKRKITTNKIKNWAPLWWGTQPRYSRLGFWMGLIYKAYVDFSGSCMAYGWFHVTHLILIGKLLEKAHVWCFHLAHNFIWKWLHMCGFCFVLSYVSLKRLLCILQQHISRSYLIRMMFHIWVTIIHLV